MKLDTFVALIKDLRTNAISDDTDPSNILLQVYASPYDQVTLGESLRIRKNPSTFVWGDGTSYTAYDNDGLPFQAPSCGWYWGSGGAYKKYPTSLSFDGVKDYVVTPSFALSSATNSVTFEFSVNNAINSIYHSFISDGAQSPTVGYFWVSRVINTNDLRFSYADGVNPVEPVFSGFFTGYDNQWVRVSITADFTSRDLKVYRDGVLFGSILMNVGALFPSANRVKYFGSYNASQHRLKGGLDDVRIWNVARTQAQIQAFKDVELTGTETGLVANWKFNEGQGAIAYDSTPNANNGTINGATWYIDAMSRYTLTLQPVIYGR